MHGIAVLHTPAEKDAGKLLPGDCPTLNSQGILSHPALKFASAIRRNAVRCICAGRSS